jgi:hypothetical protein
LNQCDIDSCIFFREERIESAVLTDQPAAVGHNATPLLYVLRYFSPLEHNDKICSEAVAVAVAVAVAGVFVVVVAVAAVVDVVVVAPASGSSMLDDNAED